MNVFHNDCHLTNLQPTVLAAIAKTAKDGQAARKSLEGALVTRVAMGVDVVAHLHQQIQQALVSLRDARQSKPIEKTS